MLYRPTCVGQPCQFWRIFVGSIFYCLHPLLTIVLFFSRPGSEVGHCPRLDVVHPGRAWPSSPACTWHCSLHYLFLQATPLFPHGVTIVTLYLLGGRRQRSGGVDDLREQVHLSQWGTAGLCSRGHQPIDRLPAEELRTVHPADTLVSSTLHHEGMCWFSFAFSALTLLVWTAGRASGL